MLRWCFNRNNLINNKVLHHGGSKQRQLTFRTVVLRRSECVVDKKKLILNLSNSKMSLGFEHYMNYQYHILAILDLLPLISICNKPKLKK